MKIRRYQKGDDRDIWELHNQVFNDVGEHTENGLQNDDLKDINASYSAPGGSFLVIESGHKIVGCGGIIPVSATCCEVRKMRIKKEYQGRGLGKKMLQTLEECAWEKGFTEVVLHTTTGQTAANHLYERGRYQVTSQEELGGFVINHYCKWLA